MPRLQTLIPVRKGQHGFEIVGAAFLILHARPFVGGIVAMGMGMDMLAVAARDPGDDIGPAVLVVAMDVKPGDG